MYSKSTDVQLYIHMLETCDKFSNGTNYEQLNNSLDLILYIVCRPNTNYGNYRLGEYAVEVQTLYIFAVNSAVTYTVTYMRSC